MKNRFKQTEIGVLPEDWEVVQLQNFTTKIGSGITPTGGSSVYKEDGRPFVRSQNVGWGKLILDDIAFINDEIHKTFPNTEIELNDVLLNISGASIGRSSYANEYLVGGNVNQHVCIIRSIKNELSPNFLNLFLLSKNGQKQIDSFQSGGNRQGLNIGQIKGFFIPLPSLAEQTAIATVLSDMDALLTQTQKYLEKKKAIKQGLLQHLLMPKAGWEVKKLGEVGDVKMCKRIFNHETKLVETIPFYKIGTFGKEADAYISEELYKNYQQRFSFPKKGNILISAAGTIGRTFVYDGKPAYFQDSNIVWIDNNETLISNEFLYYILQIVKYNTEGGTIQRLYNAILRNAEFYCPPKSEQTRIAQILTDADQEIQALEHKIEKLKQQKQGMMQALLTGKIRLQ